MQGTHLDYNLDARSDRRPTVGLIVLASDETVESDLRRLIPDATARLLHSRIPSAPTVGMATLSEMAKTLPDAAALLPAAIDFAAIGYACTSGATVLGEDRVASMIRAAHPSAKVTNPLSALKAAAGLGIKRLALLSPYVAEVSNALIAALEAAGIEIVRLISFDEENESAVARIAVASIQAGLKAAAAGAGADAVFASCTNLRAVDVLEAAESDLGLPVLASNQVLAWHMQRLAGIGGALAGMGRLGRN
ncbi:MAG: Asp/Glu racemase [Proteobacteria bacterium]|nr:Asp/Glu racemase [Pseudomonadota bacterium]